jgi:hypothetical protein
MALATYKVLFDFTAEDQDELSVSIGSFVMSGGRWLDVLPVKARCMSWR